MSLAQKLIHRVKLQRYDQSGGAFNPETGDIAGAWIDVDWLYARVVPLSAREFLQSSSIQSEVTARIIVRYRDDIRPSDRIIFRGKIFNIHGVLPDNNTGLEYLTIPVSEGVNNG